MASEAPTNQEGSLERLNIPLSTSAPDDLLTPNSVRAARFRKSKPWGLLEQDVKDFQEIVTYAIAWYIDKLHARDMDVHKLGRELDARDTQIANLNLQLASASYNSGVKEAIDRNEEDKEMADLLGRVSDLERQLGDSAQLLAERDATISQLREDLAAAPIADAQAPIADESTLAELADAQARIATLETANRDLESFVDQQEKYIDTILNQIGADDEAVTPEAPEMDEELTEAELMHADDEDAYEDDESEDDAPVYAAPDLDLDNDPELALHPYEDPAADDDGYEDEDNTVDPAPEPEPEPEPAYAPEPVAAAPVTVPAPAAPAEQTYTYKGVRLPPGIKPEDL